jgi:hypothetical protein
MNLKLSAPKEITWIIAVILGVVGLLMEFGVIGALGSIEAFWLLGAGFVLLALASLVKGL